MTTQTTQTSPTPPAEPAALSGIYVALPTPFTADGTAVDEAALSKLIAHLIAAGVHGVVPGGTTGEFTALTSDERKRVVEVCVQAAGGRIPVVAGTGALTTAEAVDLSRHAASAGAAAVMIVPPFYERVDIPQLHSLLQAAHQASGLPVMFYNNPAASGATLSAQQIADLAPLGVSYVKDTAGEAFELTELLFAHAEAITTFNGADSLTFYALSAGAKGAVWGATNLIPDLSVQLWEAVALKGDLQLGRELWAKIWPICDFLEKRNYVAGIKTGLQLLGRPFGPMRAPFTLLDESDRRELAGLLRAAGLDVVSD